MAWKPYVYMWLPIDEPTVSLRIVEYLQMVKKWNLKDNLKYMEGGNSLMESKAKICIL